VATLSQTIASHTEHRDRWRVARPIVTFAAGAYLVIAATLIVTGLGVTHLSAAVRWDAHVSRWFADQRTSSFDRISGWFTTLANTMSVVVPAVVATAVAWLRRWGRRAALLVVGLGLELASFLTANYTVRRPRPDVSHLGSTPSTFSWPSGHVAATFVLYGGIAVLIAWATPRLWARVAAWVLAVVLTTGVALSRVYRGEHHLLDVLAGVALGIVSLSAAVHAVRREVAT
jgi:membrane-associated phospholipid phosphatase